MAAAEYGRGDLDGREREALEALLYRLADDELVLGERYTEWQVHAPTLESDLALSNIAQDEFGHARLYYDLLEDFGYDQPDLIWERDPGDFRHATLVELPFDEGDWGDAILRGYLYDVAEKLRLAAIEESSYAPLADRVGKIRGEEGYHLDHAQNWLERLADDDPGREHVQAALDRLFPYALTLFDPVGDAEDDIDEFGFRTATLDGMREQWLDEVVPYLESLGLDVPEPDDAERPSAVGRDGGPASDASGASSLPTGRDGEHTGAWFDLFDEMTRTYRELGRTGTTRIMEDPE
jgi:ring-1,2-phenylacetyl-CoA epoxidase subunit PaaC